MLVLLISAVIALVVALLFIFIAVVVGSRQEHPMDLAIQGQTVLAVLARHVLGLYVRRADPPQCVGSAIDDGQPRVMSETDAR